MSISILSTFKLVLNATSLSSNVNRADASHPASLPPSPPSPSTHRKSRQPDVQRLLRVQRRRQSAHLLDEGRQVHRGFGRGAGPGDRDQVRLSNIPLGAIHSSVTATFEVLEVLKEAMNDASALKAYYD